MIKKWLPLLMLTLFTQTITGQNFFWSHAGTAVETNSLKDSVLAVWPLDELTGTIAYDSYGDNDGTNTGATVNQTGKINTSYKFTYPSSYVAVNDSSSMVDGAFSVSAWIYLDPSTIDSTLDLGILSKWWGSGNLRSWYLGALDMTGLSMGISSDGTFQSGNVLNVTGLSSDIQNKWAFVVGTYDGDTLKIYLNDSLVGSKSIGSITPYASTQDILIGRSYSDNGTWNGYLDEVSLWKRALTTDEVTILYNDGSGLPYTDWDGGDNEPDTLSDFEIALNEALIFEETNSVTPPTTFMASSIVGSAIDEDNNYIFMVVNDSYEGNYKHHFLYRYKKSDSSVDTLRITTDNAYYGDYHKIASLRITSTGALLVAVEQLPGNSNHNGPIEVFRWSNTDSLQNYTSTVVGNSTTERLAYQYLFEINDTIILEARRYTTKPPYRNYYKSTNDGVSFGSATTYIDYGNLDYWLYSKQIINAPDNGGYTYLAINPQYYAVNQSYKYAIFLKTDFTNFYTIDSVNLGTDITGIELETNYLFGDTVKNDTGFVLSAATVIGDYIYAIGQHKLSDVSYLDFTKLQIYKVHTDTGDVTTGGAFNTIFPTDKFTNMVLFSLKGHIYIKTAVDNTIRYYEISSGLNSLTLVKTDTGTYDNVLGVGEKGFTADYNTVTGKIRLYKF